MADETAFLFNPTAQTGKSEERWKDIAHYAGELGIQYERFDTLPDGKTIDLIQDLVKKGCFRTIVSFGGDGTTSEIIQGIMRAKVGAGISREELPCLAIIPFGTANDIAKSFGISSTESPFAQELKKAVETIRYGADFKLDLGLVDGIYFADAFSVGVDSAILKERNLDREKIKKLPLFNVFLRDYFLYFLSGLKRLFAEKKGSAKIAIDEERIVEFPLLCNLIINNTKIYAGEFIFNEESRANDGLLDVIVFEGWRDYLSKYLVAYRRHPIDEKKLNRILIRHSQNYQGKHIRIRLSRKFPTQIDGEEHRSGDSFDVRIVENALTIKVPVA